MHEEERIIYGSAIAEYRQALADAQWALAQANGRVKARDAVIAGLEAQIDSMRSPKGPKEPTGFDEHSRSAPKPGPPPAH